MLVFSKLSTGLQRWTMTSLWSWKLEEHNREQSPLSFLWTEQKGLEQSSEEPVFPSHLEFTVQDSARVGRLKALGSSCVHVHMLSHVQLFAAPWTVAHQASLSRGFSRQEYWGGLPFPSPGNLPDPEMEPTSLVSPALAGRFFTTSATWEALHLHEASLKSKVLLEGREMTAHGNLSPAPLNF